MPLEAQDAPSWRLQDIETGKFMTYQERTIAIQKPPLSEMFAAMSGIVCAGVTAAKDPNEKTQYLFTLGSAAAGLPYDAKMDLAAHPENSEKAARDLMRFLIQAKPLLAHHAGVALSMPNGNRGGIVADVLAHIKDMERREAGTIDRLRESFEAGKAPPKYAASYLPATPKEKPVELDEDGNPVGGTKKVKLGGRRKKSSQPAVDFT